MPRDIVVVGASAGGVEALTKLVAALPRGLHASLFVVLHMATDARSALPEILERAGRLVVAPARDGMAIRHGRVYVARPNYHLLLERGRVRVMGGPRENGSRPAIDPLFRSAAWAYGERVVGVVLSGTLDDGTAGLRVITRHGGLAVVQSDALFAGMPRSALENTRVDHALPVGEIGKLIVELAQPAQPGELVGDSQSEQTERTTSMGEGDALRQETMAKREDEASGFTCPECDGSLWQSEDGGVLTFECRVEHKYTFDTLLAAKAQEVEAAIWAAVNALEERAALLRKNATRLRSRGLSPTEAADRLLEQATEAEDQAEAIRRTLLGALAAVSAGDGRADEASQRDVGPIST